MKAKKSENNISIELSKEEALVFFDWLVKFNKNKTTDSFQDQSEERILWDIEAALENVIDDIFCRNYNTILSKARKKVKD